ncbi:MAG: aldo/keto reductase, partial [Pseudomonadota bacterium]
QGEAAYNATLAAIEAGYRSIDTGSFYQNEEDLGRAIADCGVPRDDIFVTTKIWNSEQGFDEALHSFDVSARKLGLDVVDLLLVHWPVKGKSASTWRALEKLYRDGRVRAIGVSNFEISHLRELAETARVTPMVNQVELHPLKSTKDLIAYCDGKGIRVEAWSPMAQNKVFDNAELVAIAKTLGRSVSQVVLRWHLQNGVVVIPKSSNPARIKENIDVFDFSLDVATMQRIDALNEDLRLLGFEPDGLLPELHEPPAKPWPYSL